MNKTIMVFAAILFLLAPLAAGTLSVTFPNGGETLTVGTSSSIIWTASGVTDNVKLILLNEDNSIFGVIVRDRAPGGSPYPWSAGQTEVGLAPAGRRYKIRVSTMDGGTKDVSDALFTIAAAGSPEPEPEPEPTTSLTVTSPNGGESWTLASSHPITWTSRGLSGSVAISLMNGDVLVGNIGTADVAAGTSPWNVGQTLSGWAAERGGYRISIRHNSGIPSDESDRDFTIAPAPSSSHDFVISDPVLEDRADGKKGFRVTVTDLGAAYDGALILQHYCMGMGLGNAVKQREILNLRRGVPTTVSLFNVLPQYFERKCDVTFRFDVNPDHAVTESNYANNVIQKKFCWERRDGRFVQLRVGKNYTETCEDCGVVIRPGDVTSIDGDTVRVRLEITVQNCGREPIPSATVRVVHSWYYRDANNRFQQGEVPVDAIEVSDIEQGQYRLLNRTVTLRRLPGSTLGVYFGTGEGGALAENNHFTCHPNFIGF